MRSVVLLSLVAVLASGPALAQRLPRTSPAERSYKGVSRSIERQQRDLRVDQQLQFETNQLRQEIQRQRVAPPRVTGPSTLRCPSGSIKCR
jgi:hypothetical protein